MTFRYTLLKLKQLWNTQATLKAVGDTRGAERVNELWQAMELLKYSQWINANKELPTCFEESIPFNGMRSEQVLAKDERGNMHITRYIEYSKDNELAEKHHGHWEGPIYCRVVEWLKIPASNIQTSNL